MFSPVFSLFPVFFPPALPSAQPRQPMCSIISIPPPSERQRLVAEQEQREAERRQLAAEELQRREEAQQVANREVGELGLGVGCFFFYNNNQQGGGHVFGWF